MLGIWMTIVSAAITERAQPGGDRCGIMFMVLEMIGDGIGVKLWPCQSE
jgi:hypothetical protein